jgi:hypothetical protein
MAATVRSGKLRDADVVPYQCQFAWAAGHTCGHHRSGSRLRLAPGLIQRICHVIYRPLELVVARRQIKADMGATGHRRDVARARS